MLGKINKKQIDSIIATFNTTPRSCSHYTKCYYYYFTIINAKQRYMNIYTRSSQPNQNHPLTTNGIPILTLVNGVEVYQIANNVSQNYKK